MFHIFFLLTLLLSFSSAIYIYLLKINEDKTDFSAKHYTYDQMSIQLGTNTIQHNTMLKYLESHLTHT